jgi:hypothetical protein
MVEAARGFDVLGRTMALTTMLQVEQARCLFEALDALRGAGEGERADEIEARLQKVFNEADERHRELTGYGISEAIPVDTTPLAAAPNHSRDRGTPDA